MKTKTFDIYIETDVTSENKGFFLSFIDCVDYVDVHLPDIMKEYPEGCVIQIRCNEDEKVYREFIIENNKIFK